MNNKEQRDESKIKMALEYGNNIIATLREPFLVLDKNLRVISANHAFFSTFKVREKDTIAQRLPDLGNREWDIPKLLQLLEEIIPEKKVVKDYEIEHKFKEIGQRIMLVNACQVEVPKKIAATVAVIAREEKETKNEKEKLILMAIEDITERKFLQEVLRESEEYYRGIFETSQEGLLLVHKKEGDILNSNASIQKLLGYSPEEYLSKKLWEIGVTKDDKDFHEMVSSLERDGVFHYEDIPAKTKNGLNISARIVLVDKPKVIQCNIRNITERKRAEDTLRESEERYRTLVENIDLGVCLIDKDYKFVTVSGAFNKMFGFTRDEIIGRQCYSIYQGFDEEKLTSFEKPVKLEFRCICADGSCLPVFVHSFPVLDPNNKVKAFVQIFEDITEYKKVEQAKKNLIRDMSHTLKTPIAMTEMAFDIIRKSIDLKDKASIEKANRIASENLKKLRKDITNILQEFSMDVYKDAIGKKNVISSINAVMTEIENNLKMIMTNKNIKLGIIINPDADRIKIEERDLKTILNNLLDNAVKFTDTGKIFITSTLKDKMVEVEVKDTGCGISVKDINRVFDKFYKRHAAIDGTGLGLSICKELVGMYKGEIKIFSEGVGKGTAVIVILPKA